MKPREQCDRKVAFALCSPRVWNVLSLHVIQVLRRLDCTVYHSAIDARQISVNELVYIILLI